jgi:hypothetical protein
VKRRLALVAFLAAFAFAGASATSAPVAIAPEVAAAHSCSSRYTHAALPWGHKCLAVGQFCKRAGDRYYHRYGFHCHRYDARVDRFRLTR